MHSDRISRVEASRDDEQRAPPPPAWQGYGPAASEVATRGHSLSTTVGEEGVLAFFCFHCIHTAGSRDGGPAAAVRTARPLGKRVLGWSSTVLAECPQKAGLKAP